MRITALAALCVSIVCVAESPTAAAAVRKATNIPAQPLIAALQMLEQDRQLQMIFVSEDVRDVLTRGASGDLTSEEALRQLLNGTGLSYRYLDDRTITVFPLPTAAPTPSGKDAPEHSRTTQRRSLWERFRLAQVDQGQTFAAAETTAEPARAQLEEIVVTANKRAQNVQDVPISMTVIGNLDIERRGLIGMEDYLRSMPGVSQIDNGPRSNAIVIRGISTSPEGENGNSGPTVGTYFDETPITGAAGYSGGGIDVRPVDIERIELLRGPQGTAYGSASLGGTLRIIPMKPQLDRFSAKLAANYSDTSGFGSDNTMIQGVLNVPIATDTFALRAVGYRYDESGFYRNIAGEDPTALATATSLGLTDYVRGFVQDDVGRIVSTGGRLAALWKPTRDLSLSMTYLKQEIQQDGNGRSTLDGYEQTMFPIAPAGRRRGEAGEIADTEMDLANLVLDYNLGWATLTSALSRIEGGSVGNSDASFFSVTFPNEFESFTAETRLASQLDGRLQFQAGVYYEDVDESAVQTFDWQLAPAPHPLFGPATVPLAFQQVSRDLEQIAVFGEVSYALSEKLTATVGGRFFDYDKKQRDLNEGFFFGSNIGAGAPTETASSENGSSFKAHLGYKVTEDSLLFASWAEGFRLGRPTPGLPIRVCDPNGDGIVDGTNVTIASTRKVDSDFLTSYEIGGKLAFFDRRMTLDTAIYHTDWEGLPASANIFCDTSGFNYTANAGEAESEGIELQATVYVLPGLKVDLGGSYMKAELTKDVPAQGWLPGSRLPGAPKVNANLAAEYAFDIAGHAAFVRADSFYVGKFYGDLSEAPSTLAGDYVKVDARAGVALGKVTAELFVRNLTNEDAFTWRSLFPGANPFAGYRMRPRTVGIQLGYTFE